MYIDTEEQIDQGNRKIDLRVITGKLSARKGGGREGASSRGSGR